MKAKEYFDKYEEKIRAAASDDRALYFISKSLLIEFHNELSDMIKKRGITTDDGAVGAILEMNTKWNALGRRIEEKIGIPMLKRNGFRNIMVRQLPGLDKKLKARGVFVEEVKAEYET